MIKWPSPKWEEIKKEVDRRYHLNTTSEGRINHISDYVVERINGVDTETAMMITTPGSKNDPAMLKGEGVRTYVARRIGGIFNDLAVIMADMYADELGENMPTGALAFDIMAMEIHMLQFWAKYADKQAKAAGRGEGERGE